jgi:hypothetical protein
MMFATSTKHLENIFLNVLKPKENPKRGALKDE